MKTDEPTSAGRDAVPSVGHTKGPWTFRLYATDDSPEELRRLGMKPIRMLDNSAGMAISGENGRIAVVDCQASYKRGQGHATECAERDANARLIASSPDYYAGFEALLAAEALGESGNDVEATLEYARGMDLLRAAHAKASPTTKGK